MKFFYHLCTSCGFCGTKEAFDLTIEDADFVEEFHSLKFPEIHMLTDKIHRAMICQELLAKYGIIDDDCFDLANGWVRAYWWASDKGKEREYALKALNYFEEAAKQHLIPSEQRATIEYLRGEINRRIGRKQKANEYFGEAIKLTKKGNEIHELAIRQNTAPEENM